MVSKMAIFFITEKVVFANFLLKILFYTYNNIRKLFVFSLIKRVKTQYIVFLKIYYIN
nr:MAG TPA: hypothetical protein [Caudoviricetes sp.]